VFDEKGYLRLTDLGISREWRPNNAADTSGTPGYMAPEVITKNNHSFPVDFFAIGVIAYELMLGKVAN
jgi:serine/threonine protein kinase